MVRLIASAQVLLLFALTLVIISDLPAIQDQKSEAPVAISPDGRFIATGKGNAVSISEAQTEKELLRYVGHTAPISVLAFSPDGKLLAVGSQDKSVSLLETSTGRQLRKFQLPGPVVGVNFSPDGKRLTTVEMNKNQKVWDVATGQLLQEIKKK